MTKPKGEIQRYGYNTEAYNKYHDVRDAPRIIEKDDGQYVLFTDHEQEVERRVREAVGKIVIEKIDNPWDRRTVTGRAFDALVEMLDRQKAKVLEGITHDKD